MRLEKRILQLEKQVLLLKAKIKANDLWKQEIQAWIYKTFKRSIVEKLVASDSGEDSFSEDDDLSEVVDQSSEMGFYPSRKRSRPCSQAKKSTRKGRLPSATKTGSSASSSSSMLKKITRLQVPRSTENSESDVVVAASPPPLPPPATPQVTPKTVVEIERKPVRLVSIEETSSEANIPEGDERVEGEFFYEVEVDQATDEVRGDASAHTSTVILSGPKNVDNQESGQLSITVRKPSSGAKCTGPVEIRADLQKYFEYCPNPKKPGDFKLACLIEGCNSKLSMHPTNRWANSARHLGFTHRIVEFLPIGFSANAQGTSNK